MDIKAILSLVALWAIILGVVLLTSTARCFVDYGGSELEWRTRLFTCQVKHPKYGWIPSEKFRPE